MEQNSEVVIDVDKLELNIKVNRDSNIINNRDT